MPKTPTSYTAELLFYLNHMLEWVKNRSWKLNSPWESGERGNPRGRSREQEPKPKQNSAACEVKFWKKEEGRKGLYLCAVLNYENVSWCIKYDREKAKEREVEITVKEKETERLTYEIEKFT